LANFVFVGLWWSYDGGFKRVFGDGERTQDEEDGVAGVWGDEKGGLLLEV